MVRVSDVETHWRRKGIYAASVLSLRMKKDGVKSNYPAQVPRILGPH